MRLIYLVRNYGVSSKSSPNVTASRLSDFSINNSVKMASENILAFIWRSANVVSSTVRPVVAYIFKMPAHQKIESNENESTSSSQSKKPSTSTHSAIPEEKNVIIAEKPKDLTNIPVEKLSGLEEAFFEWIADRNLYAGKKEAFEKEKSTEVAKKAVCRVSLENRSRSLVKSLNSATTISSRMLRLEEIYNHLLEYPQQKNTMMKEGLLRTLLWFRYRTDNEQFLGQLRVTLSLLGYHNPPQGNGIRILSIDGGGTRAILSLEILKQLEAKTNKKVYQLFDYMCGVSSGAILTFLLGGLQLSIHECETLYHQLSKDVFTNSPFWGTGRLVWNHAYYDTTIWVDIIKSFFKDKLLIDTARDGLSPKLGAVSAVMNLPSLRAFVFRNYDFSPNAHSQYLGSCDSKMWEAIRASGAAPGYFQEFCLNNYLHQDGGVMVNNPSALAIHEARLLWPNEPIQCVFSLGTGRYIPQTKITFTSTSIKTKILKIIDSATDTQSVHIALNDLLSYHTYFRFNPYLSEWFSLDENRPDKLQQMKMDAQMYLRRNDYKFQHCVNVLTQSRSKLKRVNDWLKLQKSLFF